MKVRYSVMVVPYRYFPKMNVGMINPTMNNRKSMDVLFLMGNKGSALYHIVLGNDIHHIHFHIHHFWVILP